MFQILIDGWNHKRVDVKRNGLPTLCFNRLYNAIVVNLPHKENDKHSLQVVLQCDTRWCIIHHLVPKMLHIQ